MTEDELLIYAERVVIWAYGKKFSINNSHNKDDLMQSARLNILIQHRRTQFDDEMFKNCMPKYAIQGMVQWLRDRYHLYAESGYLEISVDSLIDARCSMDYSLAEWALFHDVHVVSKDKIYESPQKIRFTMDLLYQGYNFEEIAQMRGTDRGNVCKQTKRFGRRLLSAWASC